MNNNNEGCNTGCSLALGVGMGIFAFLLYLTIERIAPSDIKQPARAWELYKEAVDLENKRHGEAFGRLQDGGKN